jgi:hypothetical protein
MITRRKILCKLRCVEESLKEISASFESFKCKFNDGSSALEMSWWINIATDLSELNCYHKIFIDYKVFLDHLNNQHDEVVGPDCLMEQVEKVLDQLNFLKKNIGLYIEARDYVSVWGRNLESQLLCLPGYRNQDCMIEKARILLKEIVEFRSRGIKLCDCMKKEEYAKFELLSNTLFSGMLESEIMNLVLETPWDDVCVDGYSPQYLTFPYVSPRYLTSPYVPYVRSSLSPSSSPFQLREVFSPRLQTVRGVYNCGLGKSATAREIDNEVKIPPDSIIQEEYHKKTEKIYLEAETYKSGPVKVAKSPTVEMGSSLIVSTLTHTPEALTENIESKSASISEKGIFSGANPIYFLSSSACSVSPGMIKEYKGEGELSKPTPLLKIFNDPQHFLSKIRLLRGDECDNIIFERNVLELEIYDQRQILVFGSKVFDTGWMN